MSWIYVTEAGARLGLRGGRYVISRENEVVAEVPSELVEGGVKRVECEEWRVEWWCAASN